MASLRRPSTAIPRGSGQTHIQSGPRPPLPTAGDNNQKRKSKIGDKIKKRMSMRYGDGNDSFSAPAVPLLPGQHFLTADPYGGADFNPDGRTYDDETGETLFGQYGSPEFAQSGFDAGRNRAGVGSGDRLGGDEGIRRRGAADATREEEWDLEELGKEGFDLAGYVKRVLTGADEEEKKRFRAALMREQQTNKKELQRSVFKHYAEFVTISKEISTLENDMLELKELLGQWKDLPQLMGMEDTLAPTLDKNGNLERRRTQRNSVLDLQNMYRSQLTQLWSIVEGSQKYLPVVPGRHLVFEAHSLVELNAATYKPKQNVSMFLLSDVLLIAGKRRMKGGGTGEEGGREKERGRMVAERCWQLSELVIVDVKDGGELSNVLKIQKGKEHCVYRTAKPEEKKALLSAFKQVSRELGEKKRKDNEREQERRKTMWLGDKSSNGGMPGLGSPGRPLSTIGTSMTDMKDFRWIDEYGDELTMAIATRDWDEAVKLVEKGSALLKTIASNPAAHSILSSRHDQLLPSLISQLTHDLSSPTLRKTTAAHLVSLLLRLDQADLARDTFLAARRDVMLKRVRGIKCEGDISIYVSELAVVCFTVVRHTSDWYMGAFKENRMASGFVTWAKEQIETFADLFRRQVYAPNVGRGVADECLHVTASHNRKLLRDVGLDFTYLLSTLLQPDPSASSPHPIFSVSATSPLPPSLPGAQDLDRPFSPFSPPMDVTSPPLGAGTRERSRSGGSGHAMGYGMGRERSTSGAGKQAPGGYPMGRDGSHGSGSGGGTAPLIVRNRVPSGVSDRENGRVTPSGRMTPSGQGGVGDPSPKLPPRSERRPRMPQQQNSGDNERGSFI
ncbi:hypothetical protein IAT38_006830 [Cryptococcus sp. DSM 104549]